MCASTASLSMSGSAPIGVCGIVPALGGFCAGSLAAFCAGAEQAATKRPANRNTVVVFFMRSDYNNSIEELHMRIGIAVLAAKLRVKPRFLVSFAFLVLAMV